MPAAAPVDWADIRARLWNMISYAIGRHDYYERVRRDFLTAGLGIIAAATALEAILFKESNVPKPWFLVVGGITIAVTGLILVIRYVYEASPDYPYRGVSDIRSWYHYYNLSGKSSFSVEPEPVAIKAQQEETLDQLTEFTKRWLEWARPDEFNRRFLVEDLEQVFILYMLQQYKRTFSKKLGKILIGGMTAFVTYLAAHVVTLYAPAIAPQCWGVCVGITAGVLLGVPIQYRRG